MTEYVVFEFRHPNRLYLTSAGTWTRNPSMAKKFTAVDDVLRQVASLKKWDSRARYGYTRIDPPMRPGSDAA